MTDVLFTRTRCSQEVEEASHVLVGLNFVLLCVCADLVGVHANHGDLDRACKVEVVVAQVIGCSFEIVLIQGGCVIGNTIQDWLGCSYGRFVWNKVEVIKLVPLILNNTSINTGAWARVEAVLVLLVEESVLDVSIDEAEHNLRLVPLSGVFKHVSYDLDFVLLDL